MLDVGPFVAAIANATLVAGLWTLPIDIDTAHICLFHAAGYLLDNEKEYPADV